MDFAKLFLEYLRTLIWPVILITAFFSYEKEIIDLLKNRKIDAFGISIGERIDNIAENSEAAIKEITENINSLDSKEEILSKLESINKNIKKDLSQVRQQTSKTDFVERQAVSSIMTAAKHEREGFEAILNKNIGEAIRQFNLARILWPDYHNVSEIERLLLRRQSSLNNPAAWKELYQLILKKYSWGMPDDLRLGFKKASR